ncbi:MAG: SAM-dependent chlorinase/fluorinase [Proteobacteria bacterium]|nr:SAM-dependent chlorinase/fluorinase [Pseudomonadota bacterium]
MLKKLGVLFMVLTVVGCSIQSGNTVKDLEAKGEGLAPVVLMSDFGTYDDGVAICKGTMLKIQPMLTFIDITHQIPTFSVKDAARFLANATPHFPAGTVFVVLVERHSDNKTRPIVAKNKRGQYFVVSDNGILSLVAERDGLEKVREISLNPWLTEKKITSTFMGRDVFAPIAAHLARGDDWTIVGPEIENVSRLNLKSLEVSHNQITGEVIALDGPFGNLITNITATALLDARYVLGDKVSIVIGETQHSLPFVKTFDDVAVNAKLIYVDSTDHVAVAINQGNFAKRYRVKPPLKIIIKAQKNR